MTARMLFELADAMDRIKSRIDKGRAALIAAGIGKHAGGTVYLVKRTKVRGYTRRAFTAVRIRRMRK